MRAGWLAVVLVSVAAAPARAEQPEVVRLTLAETVARARQASARLLSLDALQDGAREGLRGARSGRLPQLDLQASYSRNSDVPELAIAFPGQPPRTLFPNIPDNWRTRVGASLPVYTGGRVGGQIAAAERQQRAAAADRDAGDLDLVFEARAAFFSLVAAQESARVLGEALAAYDAHLKDARSRQELGLAASNEVLAVTVERERAELGRVQAANAAAVSNANLQRLIGLPPGTRVEPQSPFEPGDPPPDETEPLVERALASRPELAALRARADAAEAQARVARSASLPQASVQAGYDFANPNSRILPLAAEWKGTWSLGVNLSLTAFDGGRASAAAAQARAQAEATRQQLVDQERRVRQEVTARALDLSSAQAAVAVAGRALEAARENLRVSRDRYREGVASSSDLLDAETLLLRTGLEQTQALVQVQLARASLDRAAGR